MGTGVTTFVFKAETKVLLGRIGPPLDTQDAISRPGWIPAILKGVDRNNNGSRWDMQGAAPWELRKRLASAQEGS